MSNNYFDDNPRGRSRGPNDYFRENRRPVKVSGRGNVRGGGRGSSRERRAPVPLLVVIDVLMAALILLVFYVTNYEIQPPTEGVTLPTPTATAVVIAPSATNSAVPTDSAVVETPTAIIDPNNWRAKFADKFTSGEVETTENSYKSANISITIEKVMKDETPYFIADIYVADPKYFRTAFAKKADVLDATELTEKIAEENNAILAINGDYCKNNKGLIIRNGKYYRAEMRTADVLIMYWDGTMKTLSPQEIDVEKVKSEGPYQVWSFGPMLLKDGQAMTEFNSDVTRLNPRSAIGYYEPGHYCFVQVGGRRGDYSLGCTMKELSQLFFERGCTVAYNLDGGQTSEIIFMGKMLNQQNGRRSTSDILYIGE